MLLSSLKEARSSYRSARELSRLTNIWKLLSPIPASASGRKTRNLSLKIFASSMARRRVSTAARAWVLDSVEKSPLPWAAEFVARATLVAGRYLAYFCRPRRGCREHTRSSKHNLKYCNDCAHELFVI